MSLRLAGCVMLDENKRIFLLHRNKNGFIQWELPGGKVDNEEELEETAIREIKEELGVAVNIKEKLGETEFEENGTDHFYTWFLAEIYDGEISICEPETFDDLGAFSIDELSTLKLSNNMIKLRESILSGKIKIY